MFQNFYVSVGGVEVPLKKRDNSQGADLVFHVNAETPPISISYIPDTYVEDEASYKSDSELGNRDSLDYCNLNEQLVGANIGFHLGHAGKRLCNFGCISNDYSGGWELDQDFGAECTQYTNKFTSLVRYAQHREDDSDSPVQFEYGDEVYTIDFDNPVAEIVLAYDDAPSTALHSSLAPSIGQRDGRPVIARTVSNFRVWHIGPIHVTRA